ncbi:helix-turn-helix domain-containing protein [Candidatus Enterovibrio escicola]|uniref:helix-turn-helix domain-containing protein n=1 Tax=Candidatus Enterovibrio escicola TaxID=1927127 RepID=UPI0012383065|nr:helix-turn-helix domain-containing protein [Candidatus Enterovibrio escacola]
MCTAHKQLNDNDHFYIEQRLAEGDSFSQLAQTLGCAQSTISREIRSYIPDDFHGVYCHRLASKQAKETYCNTMNGLAFGCISERTKAFIHERLSTHISPEEN